DSVCRSLVELDHSSRRAPDVAITLPDVQNPTLLIENDPGHGRQEKKLGADRASESPHIRGDRHAVDTHRRSSADSSRRNWSRYGEPVRTAGDRLAASQGRVPARARRLTAYRLIEAVSRPVACSVCSP